MKFKKGFTLVECVISMAIIIIISICFYSLISYANISFKRDIAVNIAVKQIDNALTIFEASSFKNAEDSGGLKLSEFENAINWAFEDNVISDNVGIYQLYYDKSGQLKLGGEIEIKFWVWKENSVVCFNAQAKLGNKIIYKMEQDFKKLL